MPYKITDQTKRKVESGSKDIIASHFRHSFIKPPSPDAVYAYLVDISTKWRGNNFYFISHHRCRSTSSSPLIPLSCSARFFI